MPLITREQYEATKKIVDEYEQAEWQSGCAEAEEAFDFDFNDYDDDTEYPGDMEGADCVCDAWQWSNTAGRFIHISDCICGGGI